MPPLRVLVPALALLAILLPACTSYRDPALKVTGATVLDQTDEAILLGFTMEMHNPNEEPLELLNFDYSLRVDGVTVFNGRRAAQATIGRQSTRRVMLPAVVPFDKVNWAPGVMPEQFSYRLGGRLHYITPGEIAEILLDTGLRRPRVIFAAVGSVDTVADVVEPGNTMQHSAPTPPTSE